MNESETANAIKEIKDMVTQLRTDVGYLYGLVESVVENFNLAHKSKTDLHQIFKMNTELMKGMFGDKNFEGKEKVMEMMNNLENIGSK